MPKANWQTAGVLGTSARSRHHKLKPSNVLVRMQNNAVCGLLCEFKHDLALHPKMHLLCYYNLNVDAIIHMWASTRMNYVFSRGFIAVWES